MSHIKNFVFVLVLALVLLFTACSSGTKTTVVYVGTTGSQVVVVVEDNNGNQYESRWGNTGPEAFPTLGDTMLVDLDAKYPYNEWKPLG